MDSIERADVLDSYDPLFEVPTTGTVVGDSLFFVANPPIDKLLDIRPRASVDALHDLQIVKVNLGR